MTVKPIIVPEDVIRAYDVVRNVRAAGRLTPNHNGEHALLECIEAQQGAIEALFRLIADLQRAEHRREAETTIADVPDLPPFLANRQIRRRAPRPS